LTLQLSRLRIFVRLAVGPGPGERGSSMATLIAYHAEKADRVLADTIVLLVES
jgi:hypothetical protein